MEASLWQCEGLTEDFSPTLHVCKGVRCWKFQNVMAVSYFSWFCDIFSVSFLFLKMRFICRHPQKRELDLSILKKEIVFQFEISPGNNPKWTFFRCVIPCACTIQIRNAIVIYISFKLPPKSIRCYLQIFLPTPVRYSGEFIKLIPYLVFYFLFFLAWILLYL